MSKFTKIQSQFRLALSSLMQAPGFVSSVLITMSLTMASLFVVFSLVNSYFIKPLNVMDEKNLYVLEQEVDTPSGTHAHFQSYKAIIHWFKTQNSFDRVAAISPAQFMITSLPGDPKYTATYSTPDYFDIFNVPLVLGQKFSSELKIDQMSDDILISEQLWRSEFDRDPNILGKTIQEGERSYKVIGVVSSSYEAPYMFYQGKSDLWLHFGSDQRFYNNGEWDNPWDNTYGSLKMVGTKKVGLSFEAMFKDLDDSIESIRAEWLEGYKTATDFRPVLTPYRTIELGDKGHLSLFLLAGTIGLFIIAVVNVSNLFFSRALAQHKTLALQAVLGAKRGLLFTSILLQTLILMVSSLLIALFVAAWGIKLFKYLALGKLPLVQSLAIDINLLAVAAILSVLLAYLFAFVTSRLINYKALSRQLQSSGKGGVNQVSGRTVRVLVSMQMALASTLIILACLALTKTHQTLNRPIGSHIDNFYSVVAFVRDENKELSVTERYEKLIKIQNKLEALPNIKRVSTGNSPVSVRITKATINSKQGEQTPFVPQAWVGPDYFDHTGLKIIKGRTFSEEAVRGEKHELMVSESLAYLLEPDGDVIGKVYEGHNPDDEIVGVTEDFNHPNYFAQDKGKHLWWPNQPFSYNYIIEVNENEKLSQAALLLALRAQDPRMNIWEYKSFESEHDKIIYLDVVTLYVSYVLAAFTLLLASVGIYGVISYNLGLRRFEFGIRMALGAKKARLYGLLVKDALMPLAVGIVLAISAVTGIYYAYGAQLTSWLSFEFGLAIPVLLLTIAIALMASYRPMQKIIKNKPMRALRNE
jgi:predicted permease